MVSRQREWQQRQRSMGRCILCGKKASQRNRKFCETHRTLANYREHQRRSRS